MSSVTVTALEGIPEVKAGDDVAALIGNALEADGLTLEAGDVLTIAHKIVSKAEGRVRRFVDVEPSEEAERYAEQLSKDPRKIQIVLDESVQVIRSFKHPHANEGTMICEHRLGLISANAGVDESNTAEDGEAILLPEDPDASAQAIRLGLATHFGVAPGVIITDTFGRPWRVGQVNVAIGLAGVPATIDETGDVDARGRLLKVTQPAIADEIAAASGLVVGKAAGTPVALFKGLNWVPNNHVRARQLLRARTEDMFR